MKYALLGFFSSVFPGLSRSPRTCLGQLFLVGATLSLLLSCWGCVSTRPALPISTIPTIATSVFSTPTPLPISDPSNSWNTLALVEPVIGNRESFHVINYDYLTSKVAPFLPQTLSSPGFDGLSPDGQDLLYQLTTGSSVAYYHLRQRSLSANPFYTLPANSAGNALWLADSQHVLILMRDGGVMEVDTKTGQIHLLFSLPLNRVHIASLTFFLAPYLYFVGSAGACEEILCRVKVGSTIVQPISFRSLGAHYWLSPNGSTIFFADTQGPASRPGIYSVNANGSHLRLLRSYRQSIPIGFAADNSLVILRQVQQRFVVLKLGDTSQHDQVLEANAAPGAVSLCPPTITPGAPKLCNASIALAPYGRLLVVQATFADATSKLWSSNLLTGKQQILQINTGGNLPTPVQLLGWDHQNIP